MNTIPVGATAAQPGSGRLPGSGRPQFGQGAASALGMKWAALHEAAGSVAVLADVPGETMTTAVRTFPLRIRDAGGWRKERAERGIEDLSAIMEPGLSALLAVLARGGKPQAAARALWYEFLAARDALLTFAPTDGVPGHLA